MLGLFPPIRKEILDSYLGTIFHNVKVICIENQLVILERLVWLQFLKICFFVLKIKENKENTKEYVWFPSFFSFFFFLLRKNMENT